MRQGCGEEGALTKEEGLVGGLGSATEFPVVLPSYHLQNRGVLVRWFHWLERHPIHQKAAGLILSQGSNRR